MGGGPQAGRVSTLASRKTPIPSVAGIFCLGCSAWILGPCGARGPGSSLISWHSRGGPHCLAISVYYHLTRDADIVHTPSQHQRGRDGEGTT